MWQFSTEKNYVFVGKYLLSFYPYLTSGHRPLEIKDQILDSLKSRMAQCVDKPHQRSPPPQTERDRIRTEYIQVASWDMPSIVLKTFMSRRQSILQAPPPVKNHPKQLKWFTVCHPASLALAEERVWQWAEGGEGIAQGKVRYKTILFLWHQTGRKI